jgi:hypothetical protein
MPFKKKTFLVFQITQTAKIRCDAMKKGRPKCDLKEVIKALRWSDERMITLARIYYFFGNAT